MEVRSFLGLALQELRRELRRGSKKNVRADMRGCTFCLERQMSTGVQNAQASSIFRLCLSHTDIGRRLRA